MTPLETLGLFVVVVVLVLLVAQWRDWPERNKPMQRLDPEWRMDAERERLKAAAIWKGYRREK